MNVYCGIDFGTTNTVVSIAGRDGSVIDLLSLPTALFIPQSTQGITSLSIGDEALAAFKSKTPGRYIHSIKRSLSDSSFTKTKINNQYFTIEEIVSLFLLELKKVTIQKWGIPIDNAVVGRPVNFSPDAKDDKMAIRRLKEGFKLAQFKEISFLEEPIAASYCFESILDLSDKHFLILDYGGGTSDYSLVSHDKTKPGIDKYRVLKLDGVDGGGDHFDEILMLELVCPLLGRKATYESYGKRLEIPPHIFNQLCKWNNFRVKDKRDLNEEFHDYRYGSSDLVGVERLYDVIQERGSFDILESTKEAKHNLSHAEESGLFFGESRIEFSVQNYLDMTSVVRDRILEGFLRISEFSKDSNLSIDKMILTGGSSRNRSFVDFFSDKSNMVFDEDHFYSISKGLALYAHSLDLKVTG